MPTNFPTGLDSFIAYVDGTTIMEAANLNNMEAAIESLQAKVGIDSSAVTSSHDYKLANILIPTVSGDSDSSTDSPVTIGNFKIAWGKVASLAGRGTVNVAHGLTKCFDALAVRGDNTTSDRHTVGVSAIDDTNVTIKNYDANTAVIRWYAWGR